MLIVLTYTKPAYMHCKSMRVLTIEQKYYWYCSICRHCHSIKWQALCWIKYRYKIQVYTCTYFQCIVRGLSAIHAGVILYLCSSTRNCHSIIRWYNKWHYVIDQLFVESLVPCVSIQIQQQVLEIMRIHFTRAIKYSKHFSGTFCWVVILAYCTIKI